MNAPDPLSRRVPLASDGEQDSAAKAKGSAKVQLMIVDDSLTVRTIFKRMVESAPGLEVAATASNAERAISQLKTSPVDVILLDLEMPGMGGLEALPKMLQAAPNAQVLVISSLTDDGAEHSVAALSMGAADTMLKPRPGGFNEEYRSQLLDKICALGGLGNDNETGLASREARAPAARASQLSSLKRPEVLAIGASTGGIHALNIMLRAITPAFDLPILITQHLPASFVPVFARQIEVACARRTVIAEDGTEIRKGEVAIATGHGHMTVRKIGERLVAKTTAEPAPSGCMPSVDPMLSSLARACEGRVLAVILSGMGRDGLIGATELAGMGGTLYAQDAESSAVWGMPGAVAKAGLTSLVATPEKLAEAVMSFAPASAVQ